MLDNPTVSQGSHRLTWTIHQCLGLSIALGTNNGGELEVVTAGRGVC